MTPLVSIGIAAAGANRKSVPSGMRRYWGGNGNGNGYNNGNGNGNGNDNNANWDGVDTGASQPKKLAPNGLPVDVNARLVQILSPMFKPQVQPAVESGWVPFPWTKLPKASNDPLNCLLVPRNLTRTKDFRGEGGFRTIAPNAYVGHFCKYCVTGA